LLLTIASMNLLVKGMTPSFPPSVKEKASAWNLYWPWRKDTAATHSSNGKTAFSRLRHMSGWIQLSRMRQPFLLWFIAMCR